MAQQSTEEIEGNVGRSFIIPNDNYNWRVKALDQIKKKLDLDITISWGESWGIELSKYEADVQPDDTIAEDLPEDNNIEDNGAPDELSDEKEEVKEDAEKYGC